MNMLILAIIVPLISFFFLALTQGRCSKNFSDVIGIGSMGLVTLITIYVGNNFLKNGQQPFVVPLWNWIVVDSFNIGFNLALDGLSLTMLSIVVGVGLLIHIFASWYMNGEKGYSRFFAYTNLFIASMIVLILADNLLLMFLGWEGVGLCSYLLIGFYYTYPKNNSLAMKAFVIGRVGDSFLACALFILYKELGTLNFYEIHKLVSEHSEVINSNVLWWAALMLLSGAVGKSAQFPLQTWLADAMVGPTPVSALIHAATMVTVGIYLIVRTHNLFLIFPEVMDLVGIIGAITLFLAGLSALVQTDIKRVLAYSTMSQIGYMFLALGVQAWNAAICHLMTHAFFKALLFLLSGSVILSCHHEQNIFKMGGLRKTMPLVYICFLVGGAALSSIPIVTASFFSKGKILAGAIANNHISLMLIGLAGTFLTSLYIFRMIFIVFHGKEKISIQRTRKGAAYYLPLVVLLILSTAFGTIIVPPLAGVLPGTSEIKNDHLFILEITSGFLSIAGILIAAQLWIGKRTLVTVIANSIPGRLLTTWWCNAWGFDRLYDTVFVRSFLGIACLLKYDPLSLLMDVPSIFFRFLGKGLLFSVNGRLSWYVVSMSAGIAALLLLLTMMLH